MIKIYTIGLTKMGLTKKTVFLNGNSYQLVDGQKMRECPVTEAYPHYFYETGEFVQETEHEITQDVNVDFVPDVTETIVPDVTETNETIVPDVTEAIVDDISEVEFVGGVKPDLTNINLRAYAEFKNKDELEIYAAELGIDLNKTKTMKNMYKDLETAFKVIKG